MITAPIDRGLLAQALALSRSAKDPVLAVPLAVCYNCGAEPIGLDGLILAVASAAQEATMPSPFPGMDPYLEGEMWQEFHERLANQISVELLPQLGPKYVALLAKRYVVGSPTSGILRFPQRTAHEVQEE